MGHETAAADESSTTAYSSVLVVHWRLGGGDRCSGGHRCGWRWVRGRETKMGGSSFESSTMDSGPERGT